MTVAIASLVGALVFCAGWTLGRENLRRYPLRGWPPRCSLCSEERTLS